MKVYSHNNIAKPVEVTKTVTNTTVNITGDFAEVDHSHNLNDLSEKSYNSLTDKPSLFSGSYNDLTNKPATFTPSLHSHTISDVTNLQNLLDAKENSFTVATSNNLTLDLSIAKYFDCTLTANSSFTLSNVVSGEWIFGILNNSGAKITIAIPNGANNIYQFESVDIDAGKFVEISLVVAGLKRIWLVSNMLNVGV